MTNQHPITPTPELIREWYDEAKRDPCGPTNWVATRAAQWGADQELEACCECLDQISGRWDLLAEIRAARRPKPPSLKEQALANLDRLVGDIDTLGVVAQAAIIRRALEQLDD